MHESFVGYITKFFKNDDLIIFDTKSTKNRSSVVAQLLKNLPAVQETPVQFLGQEDPWRRDMLGLPWCLRQYQESTFSAGDLGPIPGLGRSSGRGHGNPLHYSCLENPQEQRSLVVCTPWDFKELDMTKWLALSLHLFTTCEALGCCSTGPQRVGCHWAINTSLGIYTSQSSSNPLWWASMRFYSSSSKPLQN